jgi:hypothetical protein
MPPQALTLAFLIIEEAIKQEPAIAADIQSLFNKGNPSPDDWAALRAKVMAESYASYVPKTALTSDQAPQ